MARTTAPADICAGVSCGAYISVVHQPIEPWLVAAGSASLASASPSLLPAEDSALAVALAAPDLVDEVETGQPAHEAIQPAEALVEVVMVERLEPPMESSARVPLVGGVLAPSNAEAVQDQALADGLLLARLIGELNSEPHAGRPTATVTDLPSQETRSTSLPSPSATLAPARPTATPTLAPTRTPRPRPTFTPTPEPEPVAPAEPESAPALVAAPTSASEPEPTATLESSPTPQPSPTVRAAARTPRWAATPTATPRAEPAAAEVPAPTAPLAAGGREPEPPPAQPEGFLWPARGPLTTRFGEVGSYAPRGHSGLDIAARHGAPVLAAAAGRVVLATHDGSGYSLHVVIEHSGGLRTLYAHLSQLGVSGGEAVERGEVIGRVGSTGLSTGPHLHFEVRRNGVLRDPLAYLP